MTKLFVFLKGSKKMKETVLKTSAQLTETDLGCAAT